MTMPQMETLTELKLTDEIRRIISEAYAANDHPIAIAYVLPDGRPSISYRGSTQVYSDDELAVWARPRDGGLASTVATRPDVVLMYREPNPEGGRSRAIITFRGRARVDDSEEVRDTVYNNMPQTERDSDPEKQGVAVIIDLDSVTGFFPGFRLNMTRG